MAQVQWLKRFQAIVAGLIGTAIMIGLSTTLVSGALAQSLPGPVANAVQPPLSEADVLQSIGSILQTRSDCFRIRTMGESRLADGKILARAYCEAVVQRSASYLDNSDRAETALASLRSNINRVFGRRYDMISFRWLNQNEI